MIIARIVYDWPPPWAGLAPHPYELTVSQASMGHQITVFCGRWPKAGPLEKPQGVQVVPVIREPLPGTVNLTSSIVVLAKYLWWRRRNTPDIVHAHGHFAIWIYLYRCILKVLFPWAAELKVPLVVHFHNTAKGRWVSLEASGKAASLQAQFIAWPLAVLSDRLAVNAAAACVFVSDTNREEAIKYYGANPQRSFIVESGVNVNMFTKINPEEREKTRRDLHLENSDKVILYHGLLVQRKNIDLIVKSLVYLPDEYKLLLVGPGDGSYIQELNELISKSNLKHRVISTGYSPYPLAPIAFQASDIVVLPSTWEGLPKMITQSLACGLPALVSGFKLSEDIKGLYYLNDLDPKYIAKEIQRILALAEEVDVEKVRSLYSWEMRANEVEKIYAFAKKNYL